ncbi:MAG: AlpA family transcriptional regulator [Pseudomonas sp.]|nr:AlpA family transcriptional regulator [Pseudomonas sp.]
MNNQPIDILIKMPEVCRQVGLGKSAIYELIAAAAFPAPVKLGRYSRWSQNEVQGWVEQQKAVRNAA